MLRIPQTRRQAIVHRKFKSSVSVVEAAKIDNADELAYAIRFLTDHFTYKRSKGEDGVTARVANEVMGALEEALDTYAEEIGYPVGAGAGPEHDVPVEDGGPVSDLPDSITNPYDNTGA